MLQPGIIFNASKVFGHMNRLLWQQSEDSPGHENVKTFASSSYSSSLHQINPRYILHQHPWDFKQAVSLFKHKSIIFTAYNRYKCLTPAFWVTRKPETTLGQFFNENLQTIIIEGNSVVQDSIPN